MSATLTPPDHRTGLVRPRLLDMLAGVTKARLGLVVAPAGTGKTTTLAQFADCFPGQVSWWQVEPGATTPASVLRALARVLGVHEAAPASVDDLIEALEAVEPVERLLVIDDIHHLVRSEAETTLEAILVRAPALLHVLAGGRRMPGFNLARHEFADTCLIDEQALHFRSWEVESLLNDVYHEPLPPEEVATLCRRVGGWAAGLHMFHLSTHGRTAEERRRAVAGLSGRSALTRSYLARTVLAELPAELRDFLVRTCVFDPLVPDRCERLLFEGAKPTTGPESGTGTSARILAELARRQAFTSTDDGGLTYRYHEVLRSHLDIMLTEELGEHGARQWYARAAELLVTDGEPVQAARAYARAEDWEKVRRLLDSAGMSVAEDGVDGWWDALPGWLVAEDPWLLYAQARQHLRRGRLTASVERLRQAEKHLVDHGQGLARCRTLRQAVTAWLPEGPVRGSRYSDRLREATRGQPALVAASAGGTPLVAAVGHLLAGNVEEARRVVASEASDDSGLTGLGTRLLRACMLVAGREPGARQLLADVLADAERARLPWLVRLARAAEALDGGEQGAAEAVRVAKECDRDGDEWGAAIALGMLALVRSVSDESRSADLDNAMDLLARCQRLDAGALGAWSQALVALAAATAGLPEAELEAQRADALARSAGVPGARVAALAATTRCGATRAEVTSRAGATARSHAVAWAGECGLPARVAAGWAGSDPGTRVWVSEPAPLEIWCFGGFRMRRYGRPVDCSAVKPRTRTALRLLAMYAGRPVHRETMIEALWPDMPFTTATRSLHVTLSSLRTFLDPDARRGQSSLLLRDGEAYELAMPGTSHSDVATFRACMEAARRAKLSSDEPAMVKALRTGVLAYGGELLPEDGPAEWVVREREALRRRAAEAALDLARRQMRAGEVAGAVADAERCVQIDEYCDPGWQLLADAYDMLGSRATAARVRQEYANVLASLGMGPNGEPQPLLWPTSGPPAGIRSPMPTRVPRPRRPAPAEMPARLPGVRGGTPPGYPRMKNSNSAMPQT